MAPHCDGNPRRAATLALLGLLALAPPRAPAQGFDGDGASYSRQTAFTISFSRTDARERRLRQLYLYASEDFGRTYRRVSQALPTDNAFRFEARRDGWYWFAVQTEDADGRLYPPTMDGARPEQKLCVDRVKPKVSLRPAAARDGAVGVEWDVRDENLDLSSLRLDYRAAGARDWVPLGAPRLAAGEHSWAPATTGPLQVRLEVRDKAHNQADAVLTLTPGGGPAPGATEPGRAGVMHVRSRTFQLDYTLDNIGESGVKSVDVYLTQNSREWRRHTTTEVKAGGPNLVAITVPSTGRFGITLIPKSGVGLADPPPRAGEAPQVWVEVDESKPQVALTRVDVGRGPDTGRFTVWYEAKDKFLRARPITISYRGKSDTEWKSLTPGGVDNIGYWTGTTEGLPYEFSVRVEAVDEAGNVGSAETRQTVKVDLKVPRARIGNVKVVAPVPAPPGEGP